MPPNFTKITVKYIVISTLLGFLISFVQNFLFQKFGTGSIATLQKYSYLIAFVGILKFATILGFGLRELCRSNHHQNSAGSVFLFTFCLIITPFIFSILSTYIYSLTDENARDIWKKQSHIRPFIYIFLLNLFNGLIVLSFAGMWRVFRKAEQKPWGSLIPIVNLFGLVKIAKLESYWALVLLIPILNLITLAYLVGGISKAFGKTNSFAIGLYFLPFLFYPILGFGDAKYLDSKEDDELWIGEHLVE